MKSLFFACSVLLLISFSLFGCGSERGNELSNHSNTSGRLERDETVKEKVVKKKMTTMLAFPNEKDEVESRTPFLLSLKLPLEWRVIEGKKDRELNLLSVYSIYDEKNNLIGTAGYQSYSLDLSEEKELPKNIFRESMMSVEKKPDIENTYRIVDTTYEGNTAEVDITYVDPENGRVKRTNYGILSYNRELSSYVIMEFDSLILRKKDVNEIAKSIVFK